MVKVQVGEVKRFVTDCLRAAGARVQPAREQAELITYADVTGHRGQGLNTLTSYVNDIKKGVCKPNNEPLIVKEKLSTAWVDAKDVLGATAGSFAMDLAIKKANDTGVGWVAIKGAHHNAEPYSFWIQKAANNGLIGMVFSNTGSVQQPPTKTKQEEERKFEQVQQKKIVIKKVGSAKDRRATSGKRDIELAFTPTRPFTASAAAPGLATMLHLTGTKNDDITRSWLDEPLAKNLGQCFVVVNPACFALGFDGKFTQTVPHWKRIDPLNPTLLEMPLFNLESKLTTAYREGDMLSYELEQINAILDLAVKLNVKPMHLHDHNPKLP